MKPLTITSSQRYMPTISLDADKGLLSFSGQCMMKHIWQISVPIFEWVDKYLVTCPSQITVYMKMYHFNVAMAKCLWKLFRVLDEYAIATGSQVELYWFFDEEDQEMWKVFDGYKQEVSFSFIRVHQEMESKLDE